MTAGNKGAALVPIERVEHCEVCEGLDGYRSILMRAEVDFGSGNEPAEMIACLACLVSGSDCGVTVNEMGVACPPA